MTFSNAKEMYDYICNERDLWSPSNCLYVFIYNVYGSICVYDNIDAEKAKELDDGDDYWSAYLGWQGSNIYDSRDYFKIEDGMTDDEINEHYTAMDFCEEYYDIDDWKDVTK